MAFPMPLVVPKNRTVTIGGAGKTTRQTFATDVELQTRADLHAMLVGIAEEDTKQQIGFGNPPQLVEVDNRTNKPLDQAVRKIVVLFGTVLARAAMRMVETELKQAITRSTYTVSGRLANVGGTWKWLYVRGGSGLASTVTSANPPTTFARGDYLMLVPVGVPYASSVNRKVGQSGRLNAHTTKIATRGKNKGRPAKSTQNLGFLAATTNAVKRRGEFKQFTVRAEFTTAHAVPGEVSKYGTGFIVIRPRFKGR
jgi:hypothetical protein